MVETTDKPIVVSENAGIIDSVQAAIRYLVVIVGFITAVLGLLKTKDIAGLIAYVQLNIGSTFAALLGLIALGTAIFGVFKTGKRSSQLVVAADAAPNAVAKVTS